jgi:hypothetical protein
VRSLSASICIAISRRVRYSVLSPPVALGVVVTPLFPLFVAPPGLLALEPPTEGGQGIVGADEPGPQVPGCEIARNSDPLRGGFRVQLRANLHPGEAGIELVTERFGEIGKRCCDHRDIIAKPILTECDGVLDGRISRTELDS